MDKFVVSAKRPRETEEGSSSSGGSSSGTGSKVAKTGADATLIVCPGAGGTLAKTLEENVLSILGHHGIKVRRVNNIKWSTMNAASPKNYEHIESQFPPDGQDFYLMGNSFGNRVICEMAASGKLPLSRCKGIILCGFPLYGDTDNQARVLQLKKLSQVPQLKTLVISGDQDEFLNRSYLSVKGAALIRQEVGKLGMSSCKTVILDGGQHDVPKAKGGKAAVTAATNTVIKELREFCV